MKEAQFRYLDYPEVTAIVGLTKTPIRSRVKAGTFPQPVALSSRCVRFRSDQIADWMDAQSAAPDTGKPERSARGKAAQLKQVAK